MLSHLSLLYSHIILLFFHSTVQYVQYVCSLCLFYFIPERRELCSHTLHSNNHFLLITYCRPFLVFDLSLSCSDPPVELLQYSGHLNMQRNQNTHVNVIAFSMFYEYILQTIPFSETQTITLSLCSDSMYIMHSSLSSGFLLF